MPAAKHNLTGSRRIEQGATYTFRLYLASSGYDFTGSTVESKIREKTSDAASVATFTCVTDMDPGYPGTGQFWVDLTLTNVQTAAIPIPTAQSYKKISKTFCYDVEVTLDAAPHTGEVLRLIEGDVEVSPEVTKSG